MPVDYVELLTCSGYPLFLYSAYDFANCAVEQMDRFRNALNDARANGTVILMDSGNYESFWKADIAWTQERFREVSTSGEYHISFCFDNQAPAAEPAAIAADAIARVLVDQQDSSGTVIAIVHGSPASLPDAVTIVASHLFPILIAVPERALGDGIVERVKTVRQIRHALDQLPVYCPLHLLGTGNPISLAVYAIAGADSFDGLEWCQTTVNHETGQLLHFQQWDLVRHQTVWGSSTDFPYNQLVLMHNLAFYSDFMARLRESLYRDTQRDFLRALVGAEVMDRLLGA